jgi:UDP-N-acetyl-D-mannosaminuronate dehydrogenase
VGFDPLLDTEELKKEFNIKLCRDIEELKRTKGNAAVLTVAHTPFRQLSLKDLKDMQDDCPILIDIPGIFNAIEAENAGFRYRTL